MKMSKGRKVPAWFTPQQKMDSRQYYWQKLEKDKHFIHKDIPDDEKINYYNRSKKKAKKCQYDILYNFEPGWDQYIWRCDMENPKIIHEAIHQEEQERVVPCLTSSNYGHRKTQLEGTAIFIHKKLHPMKELYRSNGVNMKPNTGLPTDPNVSL